MSSYMNINILDIIYNEEKLKKDSFQEERPCLYIEDYYYEYENKKEKEQEKEPKRVITIEL